MIISISTRLRSGGETFVTNDMASVTARVYLSNHYLVYILRQSCPFIKSECREMFFIVR